MYHTEHTVTVHAPLEAVWRILVDVEGYARIFPPTKEVVVLEETPIQQHARFTVEDANGTSHTWVSRRDIDMSRRVIAYRQLENAPIVGHMAGEWRALPIDEHTTQLVLTHDFEPRQPIDGMVAGDYTYAEADQLLKAAVERNSVLDLTAVKTESERLVPAEFAS